MVRWMEGILRIPTWAAATIRRIEGSLVVDVAVPFVV